MYIRFPAKSIPPAAAGTLEKRRQNAGSGVDTAAKKNVTNIYNLNKRTYIGTEHRYYERNYGYDDTYVKTDFFADTYMLKTIKEFNNNILVF